MGSSSTWAWHNPCTESSSAKRSSLASRKGASMFQKLIGVLGIAALLLFSTKSGAQMWSAVGSTGTISDSTLGNYYVGASSLAFRSGATGNVGAYYNVTNPMDSGSPSWSNLEFTARNPGGNPSTYANATLYRVPRASGSSASGVCTAFAPATGATSTTTCTFSSSLIDYANYYYFVYVILGRNSTSSVVSAFEIRVF